MWKRKQRKETSGDRHPGDKNVPVTTAAVAIGGVLLAIAAANGSESGPAQDPALLQLQNEVNSLRIEVSNRASAQQLTIDTLEREVIALRTRVRLLEDEQRRRAIAPAAGSDPRPAVGARVVNAQTVETNRLTLTDSSGYVLAHLHLGDFGAELLLRDDSGLEMAALATTSAGTELRLSDSEGNVRLRLSATREGGEIVVLDADGNEVFRR